MRLIEDAPIEVAVYRSKIDGNLIVDIDTNDETGEIRVNLNDGLIWDGDPESTTGPRDLLMRIEEIRKATHKAAPKAIAEQDAVFREGVERILLDAKVAQWTRA